jgi:hypothetical protein
MRRILHDACLPVQPPAVLLVEAPCAIVLFEAPKPSDAELDGCLVQFVRDACPPPAGQDVEAVQPLSFDARDATISPSRSPTKTVPGNACQRLRTASSGYGSSP